MLLAWVWGADASAMPAILALALALDAALGEAPFRRVPHPVALIGRAVAALDRRLNASGLGASGLDARDLRRRGAATVAAVAGGAAILGLALALAFRSAPGLWLAEAFAVFALLAARSLHDHVRAVARALESEGLEAGRAAVAHIVGRDPAVLDGHGVARAAIESLAENFSDGVAAPAFWYLLLGLPGMLAYKAVNTLDSMIGHKVPRYLDFGRAAARLDDALNLAPARLSGLLLALASGPKFPAAWGAVRRDARKHRSPNAGWPEAAMAGALGLKLAGPRVYPGETVDAPFIGPGTQDATAGDIRRALRVYRRAWGLVFALAAAAAIWLL
jgi:adenosylcobinamide-phosphate synthase